MNRAESRKPSTRHDARASLRVLYLPDASTDTDADDVTQLRKELSLTTVSTTAAAWDRLATEPIDCLLCGYDLSDATGIDFLLDVRDAYPELPFVIYTHAGSESVASDAMQAGVTDYLPRTEVTPETVVERIADATSATAQAPAPDDAYYRHLLEGSHLGVYVVQDGKFVYANDRMASLFGYTPAELCDGMSADDIVADQHHAKLRERLDRRQSGRIAQDHFTLEGRRKDGTAVYVDMRGQHVEYRDQSAVMGIVTDVTDRVEQARAVQAERDRLAALFENANDPVLDVTVADGEAIIRSVNDEFVELFAMDREEIVGKTVAETYVPESEHAGHEAIIELVEAGERVERPVRRETVDGVRDFLLRLAPYETDTRTGTFATLIDITERRERERELERYREMADTAGDMLYILDTEGRFEFVSAASEALTGYAPEELVGEHVSVLMDEEAIEAGRELIKGLLESVAERPADAFDWTLTRKDGETIPVESNITLANADGEWQGTVGVVRDISEQKAYQRELERQNERLDNFASVVSHDLRNPLSVATGYLEVARETGSDDHHERVAEALDRMDEIIDDVLAMARDGEAVAETAPVSLERAVYAAWNVSSVPDAMLDVEDLPVIAADEQRTRRLLENLFRNSVEHGPTGVTVTVGPLDDGFYVADDGPGIPEADRDTVFDHGVTSGDGPGLGLSIVREIVDAHGWTVSITESTTGGARFEFTDVEFTRADSLF